MKCASHWWPFYGDDFLLDTQHLGPLETGIYVLLLNEYYRSEKPLVANEDYLRRICKLRENPAEINGLRYVLEDFFRVTDEGFKHKRVEKELTERRKRYSQKVLASQAGVKARLTMRLTGRSTTRLTERSTGRLTQPQPHTHTQEPKVKSSMRAFKIPGLDEVTDYCHERNNLVDPGYFVDHYTANGWKVGKAASPMRDWKAAVRTWEKNEFTQPAKWRNGNNVPEEKGGCTRHPDSGLTVNGGCWSCYEERVGLDSRGVGGTQEMGTR